MVKVTGFDGQPYMAMIVSTGLNIEATMSCIKRSFLSYGLIVVIRITTHYAYTRTHNTHSFLFKTSHGKALTHHGFSLSKFLSLEDILSTSSLTTHDQSLSTSSLTTHDQLVISLNIIEGPCGCSSWV